MVLGHGKASTQGRPESDCSLNRRSDDESNQDTARKESGSGRLDGLKGGESQSR